MGPVPWSTENTQRAYNLVKRQVAKERNADLRDFYQYNLSAFRSYHLVYLDESGCDKRIGFRHTGWSPLGVAPVQVAQFHQDRRYHILPAYTQDGVLISRVFQGMTDNGHGISLGSYSLLMRQLMRRLFARAGVSKITCCIVISIVLKINLWGLVEFLGP